MEKHFDVIVIGAGPAGYVAAIRCAQLGMRTACVDDWLDQQGKPMLGGTCLNAGCIPSKALLESSEYYIDLLDSSVHPGISIKDITLDLNQVQVEKNRIVSELTGGIDSLFKANRITSFAGRAQLLPDRQVIITLKNSKTSKKLSASNIIIATGSRPIDIPAAKMDRVLIVDSQSALNFDQAPERLGIIGAGVIGLEMGSIWRRFGSEVTILEAQDNFLPATDRDIAALAQAAYKAQGLDIKFGACVTASEVHDKSVTVSFTEAGKSHVVEVDKLIVAVGRRPYTEGLAPAETGLLVDEGGFIHVNEHLMSNLPNVYAVGDVVPGPMLAHKGSAEGIAVAERIVGNIGHVNYSTIPSIIYTEPEIAWAGQTEDNLKKAGINTRSGSFPFTASGRARAMHKTSGMVKIITEEKTDEILGVHIIGAHASELIAEAVLAMEYRATAEDLALTIHGHPTLSEAVHEAALAVNGEAIHIVNRRS
ncbi:dihydrolipoyl dehydrogenase [bacterium BMS3Bbin11]|nr:dihydrolipoyl dehydrogenase [bacterium BMS3Abin11]GBE46681.1 dihydrolipoyl dehydrogenase [bacterium BMS3Bbin11]GMT41201.1 MAG: dihydrolipoyl dehydrogenase [bacterium]HDH08775.1 dihydrolipoyl dehydrogenase [Gammaproteobacteria bacterium]HDH15015.1 dihydrolipoyl dehydrogenase [Gammaproteobacteria bacterium]